MLYEAYEKKIQRRYRYHELVIRFRVLIITIAALLMSLFSAYAISKGQLYGLEYTEEFVYGEKFEISSSGFFSDVKYQYKGVDELNWTDESPIYPGDYQVRIASSKFIGTKYTIKDFTVNRKMINPIISEDIVEFGVDPLLDIKGLLVGDDYLEQYDVTYDYEDWSLKETTIEVNKILIRNAQGDDVTNYYFYERDKATIKFIPRAVTLKAEATTNIYNGLTFESNNAVVTDGSLVEGHYAVLETDGKINNVGTVTNKIVSYKIYDSNDVDVTNNYDVDTENSEINVLKRDVEVSAKDVDKVYDGTLLKSDLVDEILDGSLLDNHRVLITTNGSILDYGTIDNNVLTVIILDEEDNDVTSNYNVSKKTGQLKIDKRPINLITSNASKEYDGLYFSLAEYLFDEDSLVVTDNIEVIDSKVSKYIDAGIHENIFEVMITRDGINISDNYNITYDYGNLEITKHQVTIKSNSLLDIVYDGNDHFTNQYDILSGNFFNDDLLTILTNKYNTVNTYENSYDISIYNDTRGVDVTNNYEVTKEYGLIEIVKRPITVVPTEESFIYDGLEHRSNLSELTLDSKNELVKNHFLETVNDGFITDVGQVDNNITDISIKGDNNEDLTSNYEITSKEGTLVVTKREITVKAKDLTKEYDGSELKNSNTDGEVISNNELVLDHIIIIETSSNITDVGIVNNNEITSAHITNDSGDNLDDNYLVSYEISSLEVTKRNITIKINDLEVVYDDQYHSEHDFTVSNGSIIENDILTINTNEFIDANKHINNATDHKIYSNTRLIDVTNNYHITFVNGTVLINKREITIKPTDVIRVYNGLELSSNAVEVLLSGKYQLVDGHLISGINVGSLIDVNTVDNINESISITREDGTNVTANYEVIKQVGSLTVSHLEVDVTTNDDNVIYNDEIYRNHSFEIKYINGEAVSFETSAIKTFEEYINANTYENILSIIFTNEYNAEDKTNNYTINYIYGKLTIHKREIHIKAEDKVKTYDGLILESHEFIYHNTDNELVSGHNLVIKTNKSLINAGATYNNTIISSVITNTSGDDVTSNYEIITSESYLLILHREITLRPDYAEKIYDNTPLTSNKISVISEKQIVDGEKLVTTTNGSITEVDVNGNYNINEIDRYQIFNVDNNDVTFNYLVTLEIGDLVILKRPITIKPVDANKVYDGTELFATEIEVVSEMNLVANQRLTADFVGSAIDYQKDAASSLENAKVFNEFNVDKTFNYDITCLEGTLVINQRDLEVETGSLEVLYDDTEYGTNEYIVKVGSVVIGESLTINTDLYINAGFYDNIVTNYNVYSHSRGEDVTNNYNINFIEGNITINKREITIKPTDKSRVYNGLELSSNDVEVLLSSKHQLVDGHIMTGINNGSTIDVNTVVNINEVIFITRDDNSDVRANYDVKTEKGNLTVLHLEVNVTTNNDDVIYNDEIYKGHTFEVEYLKGEEVNFETSSIASFEKYINANIYQNILMIKFVNKLDNIDKTHNYIINYTYGELIIRQREISIKTKDMRKQYDGTALTTNVFEYIETVNKLVNGHTLTIETDGSIIDVGTINNNITSYNIKNSSGIDVTSNYLVNKDSSGTLTIFERNIHIKPLDKTNIYNGQEITSNEVDLDILRAYLIDGHRVYIITSGSFTDVGTHTNKLVEYYIYDENNNIVNDNYDIETSDGLITIQQRTISLIAGSDSKIYDGTELTNQTAIYNNNSLHFVDGHIPQYVFSGSIITVGQTNNKIEDIVVYFGSKDVTNNYSFILQEGNLEITKRNVTVKINSGQEVYNDEAYNENGYTVTYSNFVAGDILNIEVESFTEVGIYENSMVYFSITNNGNDYRANYEVDFISGEFIITKLKVTIELEDITRKYNGEVLSSTKVTDDSLEQLIPGHKLEITASGKIKNYGSTENKIIELNIIKDTNNVTANYEVITKDGTLNIEKIDLEITLESFTHIYDGKDYVEFKNNLIYNKDSIVVYDELVITTTKQYKSVAEYLVELNLYIRNKETSDDVSLNYNIDFITGTLTIVPLEISIKPEDLSKMYDSKPLISNQVTYLSDNKILPNHTYNILTSHSITNVDKIINNKITSITIYDEYNDDVTSNYLIDYDNYGILEILLLSLEIKPTDVTRVYNGEFLTSNEIEVLYNEDYQLQEGHWIEAITDGKIINSGKTTNKIISYIIYDENNNDVTNNYIVSKGSGSLEVLKREITIRTSSLNKEYDGTKLFDHNFDIIKGSLVKDHKLIYEFIKSIKDVGLVNNILNISEILNQDDEDVINNYDITFKNGVLEVTPRNITIKTDNTTKEYDGVLLENKDYIILSGEFILEESFVVSESSTILNVGSKKNKFTKWTINGEENNKNYKLTINEGDLIITPRAVEFFVQSEEVIYSGIAFTDFKIKDINEKVLNGHEVKYSDLSEYINVDTYYIDLMIKIFLDGDDVTSNYLITVNQAVLTINPYELEFNITGLNKVYDGNNEFLDVKEYYLNNDDFKERIKLINIFTQSVNAGKYDDVNLFEVIFVDVIDYTNFTIKVILQDEIVIEKLEIDLSIDSNYDIKVYNGQYQYNDQYNFEIINGNKDLFENLEFSIKVSGIRKDIGQQESKITSFEIVNASLYENIYQNINVNLIDNGDIITIIEKEISIKPQNKSYVYNDEYYTSNDAVVIDNGPDSNLIDGHTISITSQQFKNAGSHINRVQTYVIKDSNNYDVTSNYLVNTDNTGLIYIERLTIAIQAGSSIKEYDGIELTNNSYVYYKASKTIVNGHILNNINLGSVMYVDENIVKNIITDWAIYDSDGVEVSDNYQVNLYDGELQITPRIMHIKTASDSKEYDGMELINKNFELLGKGFVQNDTVLVKKSSSITDVGSVDNKFTEFVVYNGSMRDITTSYNFENQDYGRLTITQRELTIIIESKVKVFDGKDTFDFRLIDIDSKLLQDHNPRLLRDKNIKYINVGIYNEIQGEINIYDINDRDVSGNYNIKVIRGSLEITKLRLSVFITDNKKMFDNTEIFKDVEFYLSDQKYLEMFKSIDVYVNNKTVGIYNSIVNYDINYIDPNYNNNIELDFNLNGELEITKIDVDLEIDTSDEFNSVEYNALEQYNNNIKKVFVIIAGQHVELYFDVTVSGIATNVGHYVNQIVTHQYLGNSSNIDLSNNINVSYLKNTIDFEIYQKVIEVKPEDESKLYDGSPLTGNTAKLINDTNLIENHVITIDTNGTQTEPGQSENRIIDYLILDAFKNDVSNNYEVRTYVGLLTVQMEIHITLISTSKMYNGKEQKLDEGYEYYYTDSNIRLPEHYTLLLEYTEGLVGYGQKHIGIESYRILDEFNNDVTEFYQIAHKEALLEITKREITVKSISLKKAYDEQGFGDEYKSYSLSGSGLAEGDEIVITFTYDGTLVDVGSVDNTFDITINDRFQKDVSDNYELTKNVGKLTIE